ncbi:hypothetical protein KAT80_03875 [Candidatus Pacearchaeota archaeon]|nr:hypothetical protein [Candidatus Pacearchaeota archaeon]
MAQIKNKFKRLGATLCTLLATAGPVNALANEPIVFGNKVKAPIKHRLSEIPKPELDFNYHQETFGDGSQNGKYSLKKKSTSNFLLNLLGFGAGLATEVGVHELGHYLGAKASGANMKFQNLSGRWNFEGQASDSQKRITYASGFALPMIVSEALLNSNAPKDNFYVKGLISAPFIHNLLYVMRDLTGMINNQYNDFEGMSKAGLKREITYPLMLGIPAFQVYRLWKNKESKKIPKYNFSINPVQRGNGFMAKFDYRF